MRHEKMTPKQIELVQGSFAQVAPAMLVQTTRPTNAASVSGAHRGRSGVNASGTVSVISATLPGSAGGRSWAR